MVALTAVEWIPEPGDLRSDNGENFDYDGNLDQIPSNPLPQLLQSIMKETSMCFYVYHLEQN